MHFWGLEDDRKDSTAPHITFKLQLGGHRQCGLAICTFHLGFSLGELANGSSVERGINVLAFGLPGTGRTHALCSVGHRLVESGRSVLFAQAYRLVQDLPALWGRWPGPQ